MNSLRVLCRACIAAGVWPGSLLAFLVLATILPSAAAAQTSCTVTASDPILLIRSVNNAIECATTSANVSNLPNNTVCFVSRYHSDDFGFGTGLCEATPSVGGGSASGSLSLTGASCSYASAHSGSNCNATGTVSFTSSKLTALGTISFTFDGSKPGVSAFGTISTSTGGDTTPPTVTIEDVPGAVNSTTPFNVRIQFSEPVTGFAIGDMGYSNASLSFVAGSGATYYVQVTPTGGGNVTLVVNPSSVKDSSGNNNVGSPTATIVYDTDAPGIVISGVPASTKAPFTATFTFSETVYGFSGASIAMSNATVSNFSGSGAVYTALITPAVHGLITINVPAGVAVDSAGNLNAAAAPVTSEYIGAEHMRVRTQRIISNFIAQRADQITASDPDLVQRLMNNGNAGAGGQPLDFSANNSSGTIQMAFATSLRQMASSGDNVKAKRVGELANRMGLGALSNDAPVTQSTTALGADLWVQGQWTSIDQHTSHAELGLLYTGFDYRVSRDLLLGVIGQFDWMKQQDGAQAYALDGFGWLAGPYLVARLHQNLLFDARAAWGQSNNDISPFNTYTDRFDTDRWLARARLTGDFQSGAWHFAPHVGLIYFSETQKSYTDSNGLLIASQSGNLGRLTFGPEVSYAWENSAGLRLTPRLAVKGIWDFKSSPLVDLMTGLSQGSTSDPRARIEGGIGANFSGSWGIAGEAFYDGVGTADFEAYGGSLKVVVPIN